MVRVGLLTVAAILGLVGWRAGWLGVDGLAGTWARWLDASPSSTAPDYPLEIRPTISGVFSPEPAKVRAVLDRLKPGPEANLSSLEHALHLFGREARVPAKGGGEPVSIVELFLDADRSAAHFGGAKTIAPTRYGARFPLFRESMRGIAQPTTEAHPGETLAVLAGVGVPLSHPIRFANGDTSTFQAVLDDLVANFTLQGEIYWNAVAVTLYVPSGSRVWDYLTIVGGVVAGGGVGWIGHRVLRRRKPGQSAPAKQTQGA